jgi:membrane fusion protein (multidrug efflux system)
MVRKILVILLGVALLAGSFFAAKNMSNSKKKKEFNSVKEKTAVYTEVVQNASFPVEITTSGQVHAKEKVDLYSEVQGIMERGNKRFFEGTYFKKGEVMIGINSEEFLSGLKAQRSNLFNQIVAVMPDLQLDFPDSAPAWEAYISSFDMEKRLEALPEPTSDQEKFYIAGKQIYTSFYSIKNLEVRLNKHLIRAPFNGYVTEAMVKEGTLIRPGQKLGEFVSPYVFELKAPVNSSNQEFVKVGKKVKTHNLEGTKEWEGTITRINKKLDTKTQSIMVVIEIKSEDLWDGMFLEADLDAKKIDDSFQINRKLLNNENSIFVVKDSVLVSILVEPVYFNDGSVIVKNIPNGSHILANPVPGAYPGMKVDVLSN